MLSALLHREEGQGLAEYALILSLVFLAAVAALTLLGTQLVASLMDDAGRIAAAVGL